MSEKSLFKVIDKNSRVIEISTPFNVVENIIDNKIVELKCGDTTLRVNDYFSTSVDTFDCKYKVREIVKREEGSYSLISYRRNKTTEYLLPCLPTSKESIFYNSFFINAYVDLDSIRSLNGKFIYLAYRYVKGDKFRQAESYIKQSSYYYKTIDVSPNLVVYAFEIPNNYWQDVQLFKDGKYSQLSNPLKKRIGLFHGVQSIPYKVATRDSSYIKEMEEFFDVKWEKGLELEGKPNINQEILSDYD